MIVKLSNGRKRKITLKEVLHVPGIAHKLVSLSAVTSKGNCGIILKDGIKINDESGSLLFEASKMGNLYRVPIKELAAEAYVASDDELTLWHQRLAHLNKKEILKMARDESAEGLETQKLSFRPSISGRPNRLRTVWFGQALQKKLSPKHERALKP